MYVTSCLAQETTVNTLLMNRRIPRNHRSETFSYNVSMSDQLHSYHPSSKPSRRSSRPSSPPRPARRDFRPSLFASRRWSSASALRPLVGCISGREVLNHHAQTGSLISPSFHRASRGEDSPSSRCDVPLGTLGASDTLTKHIQCNQNSYRSIAAASEPLYGLYARSGLPGAPRTSTTARSAAAATRRAAAASPSCRGPGSHSGPPPSACGPRRQRLGRDLPLSCHLPSPPDPCGFAWHPLPARPAWKARMAYGSGVLDQTPGCGQVAARTAGIQRLRTDVSDWP